MYVRELVVSYRRRQTAEGVRVRAITTPRDAASTFASIIGEEAVEVSGILCLSTKQQLIAYHQMSRGSIDHAVVSPREVFQAALLSNASAIVVGHNHPSGDPNPSPDDRHLTRRLIDAGVLMGINVLDHVIIGHDGRYFSFQERGEMR